jgi:uncharacterized membrane protein (UPF0127 family)
MNSRRGFNVILAAFAAGLVLLFGVGVCRAAPLPTSTLEIESADGVKHRFVVELASTPEARAQGLMFRQSLAPDTGMLFDFKDSEPVAMWMKNTYLPLDMLFIGRDGRIVRIAERTVPLTLTPISSGEPVLAVLEVNSGTAARLKLKAGDRVIHPIFQR